MIKKQKYEIRLLKQKAAKAIENEKKSSISYL